MDILQETYKKDKIETLGEGFHLKMHGRGGFIYYVSNGRVLPIAVEMPATSEYDLLVFGEPQYMKEFVYPKITPVGAEESVEISKKLIAWLNTNKYRHDIGQNAI